MKISVQFSIGVFIFSAACAGVSGGKDAPGSDVDDDGDGYTADVDCDDQDSSVYPGSIYESSESQCMKDADGDGFGAADAPAPYDVGTDCDDNDPKTYPGVALLESDASLCRTDSDGDGYGDIDPAQGVEPGSDNFDDDPSRHILPKDGHWTYGEAVVASNTCPSEDNGGTTDSAGFTLLNAGTDQFQITPDGGTDTILCTLSGTNYTCPTIMTYESFTEQGLEVDMSIETISTGSFASDTQISAHYTVNFRCEGTDNIFIGCGALEDYLPCSVDFTVPASSD